MLVVKSTDCYQKIKRIYLYTVTLRTINSNLKIVPADMNLLRNENTRELRKDSKLIQLAVAYAHPNSRSIEKSKN